MDNKKEIISSEEHVAKAKPQNNKSPQKLTKVDKKKAIHENQKLKGDVDLDDNDLLNKIIGSDGKSTDEENSQDNSEYISVDVDLLHELLDCPLCKEIAKQVKTIKYCLHRFCGECIDKWLENGNTECPTCKTEFVSQKALVRDHNRDKLVAVCFPDREEHEAQLRGGVFTFTTNFHPLICVGNHYPNREYNIPRGIIAKFLNPNFGATSSSSSSPSMMHGQHQSLYNPHA